MELLKFLNNNGIYELAKDPYNLTIKEENGLYLLKYNMIKSSFAEKEVCKARGSIVTLDKDGKWFYVARPFDKFFNYGEPYAAEIDWSTAVVKEKVDGSIMKLWFYNNQWHLSTNIVINAFNAEINGLTLSFGSIFERNLGIDIQTFGNTYLNKEYTYIFELTSKETQIVISYDDGIYFLAARHNLTGKYMENIHGFPPSIKFPKVYKLDNLSDVLSIVDLMTKDEEGVVVNDAVGNRIKVKSAEYLAAAHLRGNTTLTVKKVIKMIRNESLDDYLAYFEDEDGVINETIKKLDELNSYAESVWESIQDDIVLLNKKQFFHFVTEKQLPFKDFLLKKFENKDFSANMYFDRMHIKKMLELL